MKAGDLVGGKYRPLRRLGPGAMGGVWEAVHEMTAPPVPVKPTHVPGRTLGCIGVPERKT